MRKTVYSVQSAELGMEQVAEQEISIGWYEKTGSGEISFHRSEQTWHHLLGANKQTLRNLFPNANKQRSLGSKMS